MKLVNMNLMLAVVLIMILYCSTASVTGMFYLVLHGCKCWLIICIDYALKWFTVIQKLILECFAQYS